MSDPTFTLLVEISGLCMFVPDRQQHCMQILLPDTRSHHLDEAAKYECMNGDGSHGGETHVGQLIVCDARGSRPCHPRRELEVEAPTLITLHASTATGAGGELSYSLTPQFTGPEIVDMSEVHDQPIAAELLDLGACPAGLLAKLVLPMGALARTDGGVRWQYGGMRRQLATSAVWRIAGLTEARLLFGEKDIPLTPEKGLARLLLLHVPRSDVGSSTPPGKGKPPRHFGAYRRLLRVTDVECPSYPHDDAPPFEELAHATAGKPTDARSPEADPGSAATDPGGKRRVIPYDALGQDPYNCVLIGGDT